MKFILAGLAVACAAAAAGTPHRPAPDLRQAVQQYHPTAAPPPPRQLSAQERAELRRQLSENRQPLPRRR